MGLALGPKISISFYSQLRVVSAFSEHLSITEVLPKRWADGHCCADGPYRKESENRQM